MSPPFSFQKITVKASGSTEPGLNVVAHAFQLETGCQVSITFDDKVGSGSDPFDLVVASEDALNRDFRSTKRVESGGVSIGSMSLGVPIRVGSPKPDVSSLAALKTALLACDALVLTTHTSGLYFESVLKHLEIHSQLAGRIERFKDGPDLMNRLLRGQGKEFGVLSINQVRRYESKGIGLAGALPAEIQQVRDFVAVPMSDSCNKQAAWAFAHYCAGPGKTILMAHGFG